MDRWTANARVRMHPTPDTSLHVPHTPIPMPRLSSPLLHCTYEMLRSLIIIHLTIDMD